MQSSDDDIRARIQLLKALMTTKSNLNYEINLIKIRNSYRQSNSDFRDNKDLINLSKLMYKKLHEVKSFRNSSGSDMRLTIEFSELHDLKKCISEYEAEGNDLDLLESQNADIEAFVSQIKDKYVSLSTEFQSKLNDYTENQQNLSYLGESNKYLTDLEAEISEIRAELSVFSNEISQLMQKKSRAGRSSPKKKTFVDKIKIYHQLSEEALKLRSKLLLRKELEENLIQAEAELQLLTNNIQSEHRKLQKFENEDNMKGAAMLEVDLHESRKALKKLEIRLEGLYREKAQALESAESKNNSYGKLKMIDSLDEGETLPITGFTVGFHEMKKEKDYLIEENNKLKERISRLLKNH